MAASFDSDKRCMFQENIILLTDSYKISHHKQYPPKTEIIYSYFECRGGQYPETVFFGLQYFIKRYLTGIVVTTEMINVAEEIAAKHLDNKDIFNREGWQYIVNTHGGKLPIVIKAVPEGTIVPVSNVLFTVENTDPKCFWLVNYLETLLVQVWYPTTVATSSYMQRDIINQFLKETGPDASGLPHKLVDFGVRGSSSAETAALGGASHLLNFQSTDNLPGLVLARQYYGAKMPGFSIPAAEHSTITSWGRENEGMACENMLDQFPTGLVAIVSDSYDIYENCKQIWGNKCKDKIMKRNGQVIVRPDSGNPPDIVVEVITILQSIFGHSVTPNGYKLLPNQIRVLQGDGVNYEMIGKVLKNMQKNKLAADNVGFGSGGALLQKVNRDTQKVAFKCSLARVDGEDRFVYKDPITDKGKLSKKGRLTLEKTPDGKSYHTITENKGKPENDVMVEVFKNGVLTKEYNFEEIQQRCGIRDYTTNCTCLHRERSQK